MSEQEQDKRKVKEAFKTCKGKELSDVMISYFRKYITPVKKTPVETVFDGKL
jgi:hypothetical protein